MPHEVQRLAGHASINTTMKYYVGIRESMIDRASQASSVALSGDSIAISLQQQAQNYEKNNSTDVVAALQTLISAGVIKIGATGFEPATS